MALGRPTKATDDVLQRLVELLTKGNYRKTAAAAVGISPRTLTNWMRLGKENAEACERGEAELDDLGAFYELVVGAEAAAEVGCVEGIMTMAYSLGKPELLLRFLERRYPDRWGKRQLEIVRSTVDVAAEAEDNRRALREQVRERRERLAERKVH